MALTSKTMNWCMRFSEISRLAILKKVSRPSLKSRVVLIQQKCALLLLLLNHQTYTPTLGDVVELVPTEL